MIPRGSGFEGSRRELRSNRVTQDLSWIIPPEPIDSWPVAENDIFTPCFTRVWGEIRFSTGISSHESVSVCSSQWDENPSEVTNCRGHSPVCWPWWHPGNLWREQKRSHEPEGHPCPHPGVPAVREGGILGSGSEAESGNGGKVWGVGLGEGGIPDGSCWLRKANIRNGNWGSSIALLGLNPWNSGIPEAREQQSHHLWGV